MLIWLFSEQETSGAQLELGGKGEGSKEGGGSEKPKKRIVKNPQPKLNPDRILGSRGVPILEQVFADFKPKGSKDGSYQKIVILKESSSMLPIGYFIYLISSK